MSLLTAFELKQFDSASLTANYQNFGSVTLNPVYELLIVNDSSVDVFVSTDGTTDTFRIPDGTHIKFTSYSRHNTLTKAAALLKAGDQLEIKQVTASGTGYIIATLLTFE